MGYKVRNYQIRHNCIWVTYCTNYICIWNSLEMPLAKNSCGHNKTRTFSLTKNFCNRNSWHFRCVIEQLVQLNIWDLWQHPPYGIFQKTQVQNRTCIGTCSCNHMSFLAMLSLLALYYLSVTSFDCFSDNKNCCSVATKMKFDGNF